ncbi:hypothetical protein KSS87_005528 [Heliosperma pusillum]|nr:hypothetical protein KSS87_005528 [Heliosperma pusillum]
MHMQLLNNDRVIMFDRADFGRSNISLPFGQCHGSDCTAHSIEYNVIKNTIRPLNLVTDTWCSSGTTLADGLLVQTGGWGSGDRAVRTIKPCPYCDWSEFPNQLIERRWYATNHILPNGSAIIIGGIDQFNYEFFPKTKLFNLPFLSQTKGKKDQFEENNLYPYVFLNVDGNLFIFANNRAILLDYNKYQVIRTYPTIPGGEPRNYPSTGSAVLLPLRNSGFGFEAEVLICGGTPPGSYELAEQNKFVQALDTCARIKINDPNPKWVMEKMPMARTMGDMVVLPNGHVAIINGAGYGSAGWERGRNPILNPVIYNPDSPLASRFEVMTPTTIPRMYHSTAVLLRDGRILVGGSNPHQYYEFTTEYFPTELSLEAFSPPYLDSSKSGLRPIVMVPVPSTKITYGSNLMVKFSIYGAVIDPSLIKITIIRPAFNTHSFSMSQRMVVLTNTMPVIPAGRAWYQVNVLTPETANIAPPGYYMLFVVHQDVPSYGVWIQIL